MLPVLAPGDARVSETEPGPAYHLVTLGTFTTLEWEAGSVGNRLLLRSTMCLVAKPLIH